MRRYREKRREKKRKRDTFCVYVCVSIWNTIWPDGGDEGVKAMTTDKVGMVRIVWMERWGAVMVAVVMVMVVMVAVNLLEFTG